MKEAIPQLTKDDTIIIILYSTQLTQEQEYSYGKINSILISWDTFRFLQLTFQIHNYSLSSSVIISTPLINVKALPCYLRSNYLKELLLLMLSNVLALILRHSATALKVVVPAGDIVWWRTVWIGGIVIKVRRVYHALHVRHYGRRQ